MMHHPLTRATLVTCLLALAAPAFAQQGAPAAHPGPPIPLAPAAASVPPIRDASELLKTLIKKHDIPGMAALVIEGDRPVIQGVAGVRAKGDPAAVTLNDRWHLGSCTKSITATLAAVMVEKSLVKWETTLGEAFPDLKGSMHEGFAGATLAQLCTNRAGVPHGLDAGGLWAKLWAAKGTPTSQRRMLLEGVVKRAPAYPPGTKDVYANGGFAIAGHLLETVAKKPFEELCTEHLFTPLNMTSCQWGPPGTPGIIDQPRGHSKAGAPIEPDPSRPSGTGADNPIAISPAGRLSCTIGDWGRYVAMHLQGDRHNPARIERILQPGSFERLHNPPDALSDYAYGWATPQRPWAGPEGNRQVLTHSGSNTMWFAVVWAAPAKNFAVLVCCNKAEKGDRAADEAASKLIELYLSTLTPPAKP